MSMNSSNSSERFGNTKQISPAKCWFFTWNNYTIDAFDTFLSVLNGTCSNSSEKHVMQFETGESGTKHIQGYIEFKNKIRPKGLACDSIHWEKPKDRKACVAYCQKELTRDTGTEPIIKGLKRIRPIKVLKDEQLYEWQKAIIDLVKTEPNDRTINWFWESKGNVGKSSLVKKLVVEYGAIICAGKSADLKYSCIKYIEKQVENQI